VLAGTVLVGTVLVDTVLADTVLADTVLADTVLAGKGAVPVTIARTSLHCCLSATTFPHRYRAIRRSRCQVDSTRRLRGVAILTVVRSKK
jgi:hypothetical protein